MCGQRAGTGVGGTIRAEIVWVSTGSWLPGRDRCHLLDRQGREPEAAMGARRGPDGGVRPNRSQPPSRPARHVPCQGTHRRLVEGRCGRRWSVRLHRGGNSPRWDCLPVAAERGASWDGTSRRSPIPEDRHACRPDGAGFPGFGQVRRRSRACLLICGARVTDAWIMLRTDVISDDLWMLIEPALPSGPRRGRPWNDHRRTLEAIVWRFRTGSPWRDLPEQFGPWQSVWERHHRWSLDGTYVKVFAAVSSSDSDGSDDVLELISIDSTSVRAHQHAAGARPARDPLTGGKIELQDIS